MAPPRVTGVFDTACIVDFDGDRESPPAESPFYRHNQSCSPNLEGILEYREGAVHFVADLLAGENAGYTAPAGFPSGPIDPVQMFVEFELGRDFYVGAGRMVTGMHWQVIRADQNNFILRDPSFGQVPGTEIGLRVGYRDDDIELTVGGMPRPDAITENNGVPTLTAHLSAKVSAALSLFGNYQVGPQQDNNNSRLRQTADIGLEIAPSDAFSLGVYGLLKREEFEAGMESYYAGDLHLKFNPPSLPSFVFSAESSSDGGGGVADQRIFSFTGGVNYPFKIEGAQSEIRLQFTDRETTAGRGDSEKVSEHWLLGLQLVTVINP